MHGVSLGMACRWCSTETRCTFCERELPARHEHDHFPVPFRAGGVEKYPICIECHDLKDRISVRNWPFGLGTDAFKELGPAGRIFVAKILALLYDFDAQIQRMEDQLTKAGIEPDRWGWVAREEVRRSRLELITARRQAKSQSTADG